MKEIVSPLGWLLFLCAVACAPKRPTSPGAEHSGKHSSGSDAPGSSGSESKDPASSPSEEEEPVHRCPCESPDPAGTPHQGPHGGSSEAPNKDPDAENGGTTPPPITLADSVLLLERAEGYETLRGVPVELKFKDGTMSFYAGCNTSSGAYSVEKGVLGVSGFSSTLRGCAPSRNHDRWLRRFFAGRPRVSLEGSRLTMTSGAVTLTFLDVEVADTDRPLVGKRWDIIEYLSEQARWSADLPKRPEVEFLEDGTVRVSTGCNTGRGTFTRDKETITLGGVAYTKVACVDELARQAEVAVKAVLSEGQASVAIERARLTLTRGNLGIIARTE